MPFEEQPPFVPEENPYGVYERDFDLPDGWMGKRIVLHLGGYESVAVVFINGVEVGLTKDSRLAAEFDVTSFVKRGNNVVRIDVTKWSDATFIEDQDQWWHGGITRSVKLFATNKVFIERFYTTAGLEKDCTTGTLDIRAHIASIDNISTHNYTLRASIQELPKIKAANLESTLKTFQSPKWTERTEELKARSDEYFHGEFWHGNMPADAKKAILENEPWPAGKITLNTRIHKVKAWSAESPTLYTLHVELIDPDGNIVEVSQVGNHSMLSSNNHSACHNNTLKETLKVGDTIDVHKQSLGAGIRLEGFGSDE
jgi:beta-galactosidase